MLRVEDKIRRLCAELLAAADDQEAEPLLVELRNTLHQFVERLRERLASYPLFVERRAGNEVPPEPMSYPRKMVEPSPSDN